MRITELCQSTVGLCGDGLMCLAAHPTLEPAFYFAHHRPGPGPPLKAEDVLHLASF